MKSFKEYIESLKDFKDLDNIEIEHKSNTVVNESSLSRLYKHYTEHDSGTISAFRHNLTYDQNMENTRKLKNHLIANDFSVTQIMGSYEEDSDKGKVLVKEVSFIVVDINNKGNLKEVLLKAGSTFKQDSITYSKPSGEYYLIFCKDKKEIKLGSPMFGKDGTIKSKVNGRPFIFESYVENDNHSINDVIDEYNPLLMRAEIRKFKDINLD